MLYLCFKLLITTKLFFMKVRENLILILLISIMILPQVASSQSVSRPSENAKAWMPVNKFKAPQNQEPTTSEVVVAPPLTNVLNGVSFYVNETACNGIETLLLKVINTNTYPVNISWQLNKKSAASVVEVPARRDLEGSCETNDSRHSTSLVIAKPIGLTEKEIKAARKFGLASISVTEKK